MCESARFRDRLPHPPHDQTLSVKRYRQIYWNQEQQVSQYAKKASTSPPPIRLPTRLPSQRIYLLRRSTYPAHCSQILSVNTGGTVLCAHYSRHSPDLFSREFALCVLQCQWLVSRRHLRTHRTWVAHTDYKPGKRSAAYNNTYGEQILIAVDRHIAPHQRCKCACQTGARI